MKFKFQRRMIEKLYETETMYYILELITFQKNSHWNCITHYNVVAHAAF